jgi:porphobilinogen deaminase
MQAPTGERPQQSVDASARVRTAADVMASTGLRRLAVTGDDGAWIGVIEPDDLLRAWQQGRVAEVRRRRVRRVSTIWRRLVRIG